MSLVEAFLITNMFDNRLYFISSNIQQLRQTITNFLCTKNGRLLILYLGLQ